MSYREHEAFFSVPYDFYALFFSLPGNFSSTLSLLTLLKDNLRHIKNLSLFERKLIRIWAASNHKWLGALHRQDLGARFL